MKSQTENPAQDVSQVVGGKIANGHHCGLPEYLCKHPSHAPQSSAPAVGDALLKRAYEVVHHELDCPSIGGNGDKDCKCDAVPFLSDLESALAGRG